MRKCVTKIRLMSLSVIVKKLGKCRTMLSSIENKDQFAEITWILDILLLFVEVRMDLQEACDQWQCQIRMICTKMLESDINGSAILRISFQVDQKQFVNHHVQAVLGGQRTSLEHFVKFFSQ